MEGKRYHRLHCGEIHGDHAVIVCASARCELPVIVCASEFLEVISHPFVGQPDRTQAFCFGRHNVDAVTEIHREGTYAVSHEFHYLVHDETVFIYCADDRQRDVLRTYSVTDFARQLNGDHLGRCDIIRVAEDLLYELPDRLLRPPCIRVRRTGYVNRSRGSFSRSLHIFHACTDV